MNGGGRAERREGGEGDREAGRRGSRQPSDPLTPRREKKREGPVIDEAPHEAEPSPDLPSK